MAFAKKCYDNASVVVIGLDLGSKRIGVAATDSLGLTAQPVMTLERRSRAQDLDALLALANEREAERFVVGLPLSMDGSEGEAAVRARAFGERLAVHSGLQVDFQDERLTTTAANRVLLEADLSRTKRRGAVDRVAAALILQGWLDARLIAQANSPEV